MPELAATPALALRVAMLADGLELGLQLVDAPYEAPAVDLELRFTRAAGPDARRAGRHATGLLRELGALAAKSRQPVLQQRQLDLRLALLAVRVLGEDVEDHCG